MHALEHGPLKLTVTVVTARANGERPRADPKRIYTPRKVSTTFQSCQSVVLGRSLKRGLKWAQPWRRRHA